jgi:hypothetical protein
METSTLVPIYGRPLRHLLALILHERGSAMKVPQLEAAVAAAGFRPTGRASKAISDALRTEVRQGRACVLDRGVYGPGRRLARSTAWWFREQVREHASRVSADAA